MLAQLSELLRGTLQTEGVQEVPLAEELRLLRIYLAIQQTRYGDRLRIEVEVADGCEAGLVPTLILQPLVENAIRHGFSVTPGPGAVGIRVSCAQGTLRIDVTDEGPDRRSRCARATVFATRGRACARCTATARRCPSAPGAPRGARARLELPLAARAVVMSLRVVIVDDEPLARRRLKALLAGEAAVDVVGESEDGESALAAIRRLRPDLVFLDVQMPGLDGFDVIELLKPDECPAVIFVTAYDRYAMRAFDVHAADYLLKPFERGRLRKALARAAALAGSADNPARLHALVDAVRRDQPLRRFLVKSPGRVYAVRVDDVESLEAAGHYVEIRTAGAAHLIRDTIAAVEARLDAARFVRIHRSTIVNVDKVAELRPAFHGEFEVVLIRRAPAALQPDLCGRADPRAAVRAGVTDVVGLAETVVDMSGDLPNRPRPPRPPRLPADSRAGDLRTRHRPLVSSI